MEVHSHLQVMCRVPIRLKNDDFVCALKVQSSSTRLCRDQKVENVRTRIKLVDQFLAFVYSGTSVNSNKPNALCFDVSLNKIQELNRLRKEKYFVAVARPCLQKLIQYLQYSGRRSFVVQNQIVTASFLTYLHLSTNFWIAQLQHHSITVEVFLVPLKGNLV